MPTLPDNYDRHSIPTTVRHPVFGGAISGPDCPIQGVYFCWLNARDQQSLALNLMHFPGQRGYTLVQGKTLDETRALARALGLTDHHVGTATGNATVDTAGRITMGGIDVLASLPLEEYERRRNDSLKRQADAYNAIPDQHRARVDDLGIPGVRPYVENAAVVADRTNYANRDGAPVVSMAGLDGRAAVGSTVPGSGPSASPRTTRRGTTET